jgi:hypothetical protein
MVPLSTHHQAGLEACRPSPYEQISCHAWCRPGAIIIEDYTVQRNKGLGMPRLAPPWRDHYRPCRCAETVRIAPQSLPCGACPRVVCPWRQWRAAAGSAPCFSAHCVVANRARFSRARPRTNGIHFHVQGRMPMAYTLPVCLHRCLHNCRPRGKACAEAMLMPAWPWLNMEMRFTAAACAHALLYSS